MASRRCSISPFVFSDSTYYILVMYEGDSFEVLATNCALVWIGRFTFAALQPDSLNIDPITYRDKLSRAMTHQQGVDVQYIWEDFDNYARLEINLDLSNEDKGLLINAANLKLKRKSNSKEYLGKLLGIICSTVREMEEDSELLKKQVVQLSDERSKVLDICDRAILAKDAVEEEILSKCLTVLNTKKEKIRQLMDEIAGREVKENEKTPGLSSSSYPEESKMSMNVSDNEDIGPPVMVRVRKQSSRSSPLVSRTRKRSRVFDYSPPSCSDPDIDIFKDIG